MSNTHRSTALTDTARWVEAFVIGEGLCPFARGPWANQQVRLVESAATDETALAEDLAVECLQLMRDDARSTTTLLVHPHVLRDFGDYNDFLGVADELLAQLGAEGVVQVASFHPDYRFADAPPDDPANYTNRSPHPMLHLIREQDISAAVAAHPDVEAVPARNVRHLRSLGLGEIAQRLRTRDGDT